MMFFLGSLVSSLSAFSCISDSRYEAMIQTIEVIQTQYGGVENYVKKVCGLTDGDISKIRQRLLVDEHKGRELGWIWGHVSRL